MVGPDSEVACMAYVSLSATLVTGHDDGSVRLWDLDTGRARILRLDTRVLILYLSSFSGCPLS